MPLFRVTYEIHEIVYGTDPADALARAEACRGDVVLDHADDAEVEVRNAVRVLAADEEDAIPYGLPPDVGDEPTCRAVLDAEAAEESERRSRDPSPGQGVLPLAADEIGA